MNQIICTNNSNIDSLSQSKVLKHPLYAQRTMLNYSLSSKKLKHKRKVFLKLQFFILIIISISILIYYIFFRYDLYNNERISQSILDSMELTKIYGDYTAKNTNQEIIFYENGSFSVIGSIEIKSIDISYPIISDINKEHLKISPCRFYGPMPNEVRKSLYCCTQLQK